jgi:hypothetical protein
MSGNLRLRKTWPQTSSSSSPSRDTSSDHTGTQAPAAPNPSEAEHRDGPISASTQQPEEGDVPRRETSSPSSLTINEVTDARAPATPFAPEAENPDELIRPPIEQPDGDHTAERGTELPTKYAQLKWTAGLYLLTVWLSAALFFYVHETLVSQNSVLGPLLLDPSKTVLLVSALSQSFLLLLQFLLSCVFNSLRWHLASRKTGVPVSTFLGLSRATSLWGVITLMCRGVHILWGIHRYLHLPPGLICIGITNPGFC